MKKTAKEPCTLYIFIDESGDFAFSDKGSKYFILTAVSSINPLAEREVALGARYELLADGFDTEYFHATEDRQTVRDKFYSKIKGMAGYEIDCVVAEKRKAGFALYEEWEVGSTSEGTMDIKTVRVEERFYKQICETLLQYVVYRFVNLKKGASLTKVVVILDQVLTNHKRAFVIKSIKTYIKDNFGIVPYMYFHSTKADINSQIADYCCWAIKKKWTDKEMRPYEEIKHQIRSEFEIFRRGTRFFY